jgi:hypothetical protein
VPETFRSGSSSIGGGHTRQSIARAFPGQTAPAGLEGLLPGDARPGSLKPALFCFLCFFKCLPLLIDAFAGVTTGTTTSAVAYVASIKSWIAILLMHFRNMLIPLGGHPLRDRFRLRNYSQQAPSKSVFFPLHPARPRRAWPGRAG